MSIVGGPRLASSLARTEQRTRISRAWRAWRTWRGWVFVLPLLLVNVIIIVVPAALSVYYSFTDWRGFGQAHLVGLDNYLRLASDPDFISAFVHNIVWMVYFLAIPIPIGLAGAFLLLRIRRWRTLFQLIFFAPYVIASVITSQIWKNLIDPNYGLGSFFGFNLLGDYNLALPTIATINMWAWWGFLVVVFFGAMQAINPELYEAAQIDGAGVFAMFWSIMLPGIRPTLMFLGLMTIIWSFLAFDYVYILTRGGPAGASDVLATLLYRDAFSAAEVGYASAVGVVLGAISAVIVGLWLVLRRLRKWDI